MPNVLTRTLQPTRRGLGDVDHAQPLDTMHPLTDGLQAFWLPLPRLTGSSQLYDLSSYGRHATINHGAAAWRTDELRTSSSLSFAGDQNDDYVFTPSPSVNLGVTVSVYIDVPKSASVSSKRYDQVFLFGQDDILLASYSNYLSATGQTQGKIFDGSSENVVVGTDISGQGPTLLTMTWGVKGMALYENGAQVDSNSFTGAPNSIANSIPPKASNITIGWGNTQYDSFEGQIGHVYWANRALSLKEVQDLYGQARRGFPNLLRRRDSVSLLGGGGGPSPISGTFALTDSQETVSATGRTEVSGTLSITDASETLTVDGATKISGTASITEAAEQISATGTVITTGSVLIADGGEIISAVSSLQDITGTAQITDAGEQVDATGQVKIAGTATLNDGTEEVVIIGQNDVTGNLSFADLAAEIAATGAVEVQGSLALTDAGETITARERVPARLATVDVRLEDIIIVNAKLTD